LSIGSVHIQSHLNKVWDRYANAPEGPPIVAAA
jgi:hypothetical protein